MPQPIKKQQYVGKEQSIDVGEPTGAVNDELLDLRHGGGISAPAVPSNVMIYRNVTDPSKTSSVGFIKGIAALAGVLIIVISGIWGVRNENIRSVVAAVADSKAVVNFFPDSFLAKKIEYKR